MKWGNARLWRSYWPLRRVFSEEFSARKLVEEETTSGSNTKVVLFLMFFCWRAATIWTCSSCNIYLLVGIMTEVHFEFMSFCWGNWRISCISKADKPPVRLFVWCHNSSQMNTVMHLPFTTKNWYPAHVEPRKLTCHLKRDYFSRKYIFQPLIFRGHVCFGGSTNNVRLSRVVFAAHDEGFLLPSGTTCQIASSCWDSYLPGN